jgi:hypothetical protein
VRLDHGDVAVVRGPDLYTVADHWPARTGAALAAIAVLTAAGLLSAFGVIGRFAGWP